VGDDGALLITVREATCDPHIVGLKLTLTSAVCPGARTAGSVFADARRNAGELEVIALMVRFAVPVFCRVTVFAALVDPTFWFPKLKLPDDRDRFTTPAPLSGTTWGLLAALSVMVSASVRVPIAPGVNVTLTTHDFPAARLAPQVEV